MSKEMRPSHTVDILSHALLHYAYKTKEKLGLLLFLVCCTTCLHTDVHVCTWKFMSLSFMYS